MQSRNLIFIHVPKCAGSTLNKIIKSQFPNKAIYKIDPKVEKNLSIVGTRTKEENRNIRCLMGHMSFGAHKFLMGSSTYITMVRHPVTRVISLYNFIKRKDFHPLHKFVLSNNLSLEDYIMYEKNNGFNNVQTSMLCGTTFNSIPSLAKAKSNIKNYFAAVGTMEKFDQSLELFKNKLDWEVSSYESVNMNPKKTNTDGISEQLIELIANTNHLDMKLWEFSSGLLEKEFFYKIGRAHV